MFISVITTVCLISQCSLSTLFVDVDDNDDDDGDINDNDLWVCIESSFFYNVILFELFSIHEMESKKGFPS